ncbi:MAG: hypothetical protein WCC40_09675 [Rhodomicrobium sp.]
MFRWTMVVIIALGGFLAFVDWSEHAASHYDFPVGWLIFLSVIFAEIAFIKLTRPKR